MKSFPRILLAIFFLVTVSVCNAQHEKLNVAEYNLHNPGKNFDFNQFRVGDSIIGYNNYNGNILRQSYKVGETIKIYKMFHGTTHQLMYKGKIFLGVHIGIHFTYNSQGKLTATKNWEKGYAFSPDNLVRLIRDRYKVDITKIVSGASLHRQNPEAKEEKVYEVMLPITTERGDYKLIRVDGTTGKIVSEKKLFAVD